MQHLLRAGNGLGAEAGLAGIRLGLRGGRILRLLRRVIGIVAGGIALELEAGHEVAGCGVTAANANAGFRDIGKRRRLGRVLELLHLKIAGKSGFRRAVLVRVGLHLADETGDVGRIHEVVGDELREVVFFRLHVDVEVEVRGIDAADAKVRDVAHDADGHGGVELRDGVLRGVRGVMRLLDARNFRKTLGPTAGVIVFRDQSLLVRALERCDQGGGLRCRFQVAQPRQFVVTVVVEGLYGLLVIGVIGPAQDGELRTVDERLDVVGVVGGIGRRCGFARVAAACGKSKGENDGGTEKPAERTRVQSVRPSSG